MAGEKNQNFFIVQHAGIGDFFMILPLLHALKANMPNSKIAISHSQAQSPLIASLEDSLFDRSYPYDLFKTDPASRFKYMCDVHREKTDVVLESIGTFNPPFFNPFGSGRVLQFSIGDEELSYRIFEKEKIPAGPSLHTVDRFLSVIPYLGLNTPSISFNMPWSDATWQSVKNQTEKLNLYNRQMIAVIPASSTLSKSMTLRMEHDVVNFITHELGREAVIFGEKKGIPYSHDKVIDLRGRTNLVLDTYLLRESGIFDVAVGVDTGMMHIAGSVSSGCDGNYVNAQGNKTVSLFGPTDRRRFAPYDPTGKFNTVVSATSDYSHYSKRGYADELNPETRIERIPLNMVFDSIAQHINSRAA